MKSILVTGISGALGKATTELLVEQGYAVYGIYHSHGEAAEQLAKKHESVEIIKADLSKVDDISEVVAKLKGVKLDSIVNSAGVFIDIDFERFDHESFERTFAINALAPVYLVQGLQENLNEGASIVNIAATDAFTGSVAGIAYSASKAALVNISQSFANILADRKIRSNTLALGWVGNGMESPEELLKIAADYNLLKRAATYNEVAEVISFLLSDKASYVNGATINVDGGDMATNYVLQKEAELL